VDGGEQQIMCRRTPGLGRGPDRFDPGERAGLLIGDAGRDEETKF